MVRSLSGDVENQGWGCGGGWQQAHPCKHGGHSGHGQGHDRSPPGNSGSGGRQYCAGS